MGSCEPARAPGLVLRAARLRRRALLLVRPLFPLAAMGVLVPAVALTLVATGCSGTSNGASSSSSGTAGGGDDDDAGPGAATAEGGAPTDPKQACEALIACVADVDPASAGPLVTLYGDASNCWKGGASDADACGKACVKSLERFPACTAAPLQGHYLALCSSEFGELHYDVALDYDPRNGGDATFHMLPPDDTTFEPDHALVTQPKVTLSPAPDGGEGESTTPFDVSSRAFGYYDDQTVRVTRFAVKRLRRTPTDVCSDVEGTISEPAPQTVQGTCLYVPASAGDPIPHLQGNELQIRCPN